MFTISVQGHHGRTRAISRLPVSPSAGHTSSHHSSSHHGSHTHLNGHAPKSEHESSRRRHQPIGSDSKSKVLAESARINGQLKRSSLVMDSVCSKSSGLSRQMSKEETRNVSMSATSSSDQPSAVGSAQKQTSKYLPKLN